MKLRESGFVAEMSLMIQTAVRPHAATFPPLQARTGTLRKNHLYSEVKIAKFVFCEVSRSHAFLRSDCDGRKLVVGLGHSAKITYTLK